MTALRTAAVFVTLAFAAGSARSAEADLEEALRCLVPAPRQAIAGTACPYADPVPEAVRDQAYEIVIRNGVVTVDAEGAAGRLYAAATLKQLVKLNGGRMPADCTIRDWPRFRYRGFMLDVGRNWQPVSTIKTVLDFMAGYKLNLFHWHLTDYWGWRIESKAVPELNTDAATIRNVGKRYTQKEFLEVVDYAASKGITVLPEIDVPGHTQAFRQALGIDSMRDPKADRALTAFFDEFAALVPPEKMPYIHLGTDEVRNDPEKVDEALVRKWAKHAAAKGHAIVAWTGGIDLTQDGVACAKMGWGAAEAANDLPFFDMAGRYIDVIDPLEVLRMAAYVKPCAWEIAPERKLGPLIGCWHDDALATPDQLFVNNPVYPAIVANADAFWRDIFADHPEYRVRPPTARDPNFWMEADLEKRLLAQRDRVLGADFPHPFAFVRQTDLRWRLSYADGTLIEDDIASATLRLTKRGAKGCFCPKTNATVIAETWIHSPVAQKVGAWISLTGYSRSSGRAVDSPTPARGEWNRHGATVELNGARLTPPQWKNPGLRTTEAERKRQSFWSFAATSTTIPWTDEEYFMRPPYPIALKAGWNHVRLTLPAPDPEPWGDNHAWCMTFVPVLGTSEHPREVPNLKYRSHPPAEFPMDGISFAVPQVWPCPELSRDGVRALWLDGEPLGGKPTRVFAYLALPAGASSAKKVPGIVLAHGGGGTAYITWAQTWAKKGYAAIVVDNCGAIPVRAPGASAYARSDVGGPAGWGRFDLGLKPPCEQWPYHAVGALVRAHSYLRALPEVDAEKTGLTGISWGGFLTMLAAATDRRFKFAMPVYACGYYDEMLSYGANYAGLSPETASFRKWCELFDSKHYAGKMEMPVMWFASSNDHAFPFDLLQKTIRLPKKMPALAIRVRMVHSHGPKGENMPELFRFANHVLFGAPALPAVGQPVVADGAIAVRIDPRGNALKRVELNWCCVNEPLPDSRWETKAFPVPADGRFSAPVPAGAKRVYVNVVLDGPTGEEAYPESLVSSPAATLR